MCIKAREIQKCWKPKFGDWFWDGEIPAIFLRFGGGITLLCGDEKLFDLRRTYEMWLPTQEQLQQMLKPDNSFWYYEGLDLLNKEMAEAYGSLYTSGYFDNGNEFWLAVVMWKKYHKIWDDKEEEWIKKDGGNDDDCK